MKKEVISEAVKNISEDYILEALEFNKTPEVSEIVDMKSTNSVRKVFVVGIAASLALAIGATAYATGIFGMKARDAKPDETIKITYDDVIVENETIETSKQEVVYEDIMKVFSFQGPSECDAIEFKASSLPKGFKPSFGKVNKYEDFLQAVDKKGHAMNVLIYYAPNFGEDGKLFIEGDKVLSEKSYTSDAYEITELSYIPSFDPSLKEYVYMMYNNAEGYLIIVESGKDMDSAKELAGNLEIKKTGKKIKYDKDDIHDIYLTNGLG